MMSRNLASGWRTSHPPVPVAQEIPVIDAGFAPRRGLLRRALAHVPLLGRRYRYGYSSRFASTGLSPGLAPSTALPSTTLARTNLAPTFSTTSTAPSFGTASMAPTYRSAYGRAPVRRMFHRGAPVISSQTMVAQPEIFEDIYERPSIQEVTIEKPILNRKIVREIPQVRQHVVERPYFEEDVIREAPVYQEDFVRAAPTSLSRGMRSQFTGSRSTSRMSTAGPGGVVYKPVLGQKIKSKVLGKPHEIVM